jgi:putative peptide zinc metalloprotease protein
MRESLFSPLWHRYSQQRPQLRSHVTVQQQEYRKKMWYLLINNTNGNHYRINHVAYQFVGRCDGQHTVQAVWDSVLESLQDDAPTQDEIIRLLTELDQRDLLRYEALPNIKGMFRRKKEKVKKQRRATINPFAMKLSLWDPSNFLDKLHWLPGLIFNPLVLIVWLVVVVFALMSASANWDQLTTHFGSHMATPRYLLLTWLSFPFVKALHELGHALAVRNWGGQVRDTGITLFLLTPAPYVDASASSAFRRTYQRVVVGAVGMMMELLLASVAMWVWFSSQQGLVHDIAFVVMFICGVSTLLFNGNPLLRFDAYYILCDTFDLPNLATRSRTYWITIFKKLVLGAKNVMAMDKAEGEGKWLFFYAPLSFVLTLFLMTYAVLWLGEQSLVIGIIGAVFVLLMLVLKPLYSLVRDIFSSALLGAARFRAKFLVTLSLGGIVAAIVFVPVPFSSTAQGVIWIPDEARIRPETEGFIKQIRVNHGDPVEPDQVLIVLEDPTLVAEHYKLQEQIAGLQSDQFNVVFTDPNRAMNITQKIEKVQAEIARLEEKMDGLMVRSKTEGILVLPHQDDLPNTFVKKGEQLGYVLAQGAITVRVAVPEPNAALLRERLQRVLVRTADHPNEVVSAEIDADANTVTRTLPSAALGDANGGRYATDPSDKEGLTATEAVVLIDLILPSAMLERSGVRANVRFDHGSEPIAQQVYRQLNQLFLRYFAASG